MQNNLSINRLKPNFVFTIFKYSVRTSKRTPHFSIKNINNLMLFKTIIAVYGENHREPIQNTELLLVNSAGTYSYHLALKG
jgi:hypothetical protein